MNRKRVVWYMFLRLFSNFCVVEMKRMIGHPQITFLTSIYVICAITKASDLNTTCMFSHKNNFNFILNINDYFFKVMITLQKVCMTSMFNIHF